MAVAPGRGRKPKPVARKQAAGNPGRRELNTNEPNFDEISNVDPPEWMVGDGRSLWEVLAPQLCRQKVLKITDIQNLEAYCDAYARFRDAQREVAIHGTVLTDDNGRMYKNPAATVINESVRQMATIGGMLGLDPSSRQRLMGAGKKDNGNPFADLIPG